MGCQSTIFSEKSPPGLKSGIYPNLGIESDLTSAILAFLRSRMNDIDVARAAAISFCCVVKDLAWLELPWPPDRNRRYCPPCCKAIGSVTPVPLVATKSGLATEGSKGAGKRQTTDHGLRGFHGFQSQYPSVRSVVNSPSALASLAGFARVKKPGTEMALAKPAKHAKAERETHRSRFSSFPSVRWIGCAAFCFLRALLGNSI